MTFQILHCRCDQWLCTVCAPVRSPRYSHGSFRTPTALASYITSSSEFLPHVPHLPGAHPAHPAHPTHPEQPKPEVTVSRYTDLCWFRMTWFTITGHDPYWSRMISMNWTYGKLPEPIHQILAPCQSNLVWPGSPAQRSISSGEAKRKNGASCHRGCTHLTKPRSATTGTDWPFVCGVIWESLSASMVWMQTLEVWLLLGPLCFFILLSFVFGFLALSILRECAAKVNTFWRGKYLRFPPGSAAWNPAYDPPKHRQQ